MVAGYCDGDKSVKRYELVQDFEKEKTAHTFILFLFDGVKKSV